MKSVSREKERRRWEELWRRYNTGNEPAARETRIEENIPLVKYVAGRLAMNLPSNVDLGDLVSVGFCGPLDALEYLDAERIS